MADAQSNIVDPTGMGAMLPDPTQLQGAIDDQRRAQLAALANTPAAGVRAQLGMQDGFQRAQGGDPRVQQAQQQQAQVKSILSKVQADAPANEDPLDFQQRLASGLMTGMAASNPQLAIQAGQRLVAIQAAKDEREKLSTQVAAQKATTEETLQKLHTDQYNFAMGKLIPKVLYRMPPPNADGSRGDGAPIGVTMTDENGDRRIDHDQLVQEYKAAQEKYPGGEWMTGDQLNNARVQAAQLGINRAQIMANADIQKALIAAQNKDAKPMTGNSLMMSSRLVSSAGAAAQSLANISNMRFGANAGTMGIPGSTGGRIMDVTGENIKNALNDQDAQRYNAEASTLWRKLGMIESQGGIQGGQGLAEQMKDGLTLRKGDSVLSIMQKLADARQLIETEVEQTMANPSYPEEMKQAVRPRLEALKNAIPYTPKDVQDFSDAQAKNNKLTYHTWAEQNLGDKATPTASALKNPSQSTVQVEDDEHKAAKAALARGVPLQAVRARYTENTGKQPDF